jgi:hypothetical protein
MSYVTTFDMVFWVNILVAATLNVAQLAFTRQFMNLVFKHMTTTNGRVALISAMVVYTATAVALLVWSWSTSFEGLVTASVWYSLAMAVAYKPMVRLNLRAMMGSAH